MVTDNIEWLEAQRDFHANARDAAFREGDVVTANSHDDSALRYWNVIVELREARMRLDVFSEVLQQRIIVAAKEATSSLKR